MLTYFEYEDAVRAEYIVCSKEEVHLVGDDIKDSLIWKEDADDLGGNMDARVDVQDCCTADEAEGVVGNGTAFDDGVRAGKNDSATFVEGSPDGRRP